MLARSRSIELAGTTIETPLLVPAVSSKALGPIELVSGKKSKLEPASRLHTDVLIRGISEAILVSAYDIHHGFLYNARAFRKGFKASAYAGVKVVFIDSGWYEKSVGLATGQWYYEVGDHALSFERKEHAELVDSLDKDVSAVLVSWDSSGTYDEQVTAAQDFFGGRRQFSSDLLLKPPRTRRYHNFNDLSAADVGRLKAFDIVGVTEKELGESLLDRLTSLGRLRTLMDEAEVDAPIHVFGGLDPLLTPLYVAVGAEIFDGLSWLRYAFREGLSISVENAALLDQPYSRKLPASLIHQQLINLSALEQLAQEMKIFIDKGCDWSKLRHGEELRPVFEAFEAAFRSTGRGR